LVPHHGEVHKPLDRWEQQGLKFILGIEAHEKLVKIANELVASAWKQLERLPKYEILTEPRRKSFRYKEQIVIEKAFANKVLVAEDVAESDDARSSICGVACVISVISAK